MPHVLLVDDDPEQLEWLSEFVKGEGFTVAKATSLRTARIQLTQMRPDVLLTDLQLPDGNGVELVDDLEQREATEVVMITGHATVESAVNALRAGATDYLVKPVEIERLRSILQRVPGTHELRAEIGDLRQELRGLGRFGHMIGSSPVMQKLYDQLNRVSPTSATVLLIGESGTGKELAAQTIHDLSRRKKRPFLPLNCGAVSPNLIESELFGHEKGSFTGADRQHKGFFERAHGGTLFLDEITEMPAELQVKLLRVLETGTFMRVGTNTPIATDASTFFPSSSRRCASAAPISRSWHGTSWKNSTWKRTPRRRFRLRLSRPCIHTAGPAMSASLRTTCSGCISWPTVSSTSISRRACSPSPRTRRSSRFASAARSRKSIGA
jgi:two-component system response regulator AtoC